MSSICVAQYQTPYNIQKNSSYTKKNNTETNVKTDTSLDKALKDLTSTTTGEKIDVNKEIEILEEIEKTIEKAIKEKIHTSTDKTLTNSKLEKIKNLNEENIADDDYEKFLEELRKEETQKKDKTKQKDFIQNLQSDDINVVIEINKYFIDDQLCPVDLQDCLALALKNNFNIRIFGTRATQGKWNYKNTFAAFFPNASIRSQLNRLNGDFIVGGVAPLYVNESPFWNILRLDWVLYQGGARFHRMNAQKSRYYGTIKNLEYQKQQVLRDAAVSYYNLLGLKLGIEILTRNLKETRAQQKLTTQNFEAGIGTKFDVLRAKAEVAQAEQRLISSYNVFRLEQANLANILGVNVFTSLLPVEEDVEKKKLMDEELSMQDISKLAMRARPDLNSQRFEIKALLNDKKRIFSGFLPTVDTFWQSGWVGTSKDGSGPSNSFGIGMTIPIVGTNFAVEEYTRLKEIDAVINEARLSLRNSARKIQQDIVSSFYSTKTAEERVEAAKEEVIAADESLRLAFLRLEAGLGIYVDVLQSQTAKTDAKINLIRAIIDHNIAQVNLLFDSGTISAGNILKDYDKYLSRKYTPPTKEELQKEEGGEIKLPQETESLRLPSEVQSK